MFYESTHDPETEFQSVEFSKNGSKRMSEKK